MQELQALYTSATALHREGSALVLATVVRVSGSAYRRPGAHLLIADGKPLMGSVSGGCLEADLAARSEAVLESGAATLVTYDMFATDEMLWGLGLGCGGVVEILLEPLPPSSPLLGYWRDCLALRRASVVATVYRGPDFGARYLLEESQEIVSGGRSFSRDEGENSVLLELLVPPNRLQICGGGADAIPLARLSKELGWEVRVMDRRPGYANLMNFPQVDQVKVADPATEFVLDLDENSAAVVMSHHWNDDREFLRKVLATPVPYIGLLGPRERSLKIIGQLRAEGVVVDESRLHFPVGLDIGAETPAEIALAILAEIQALHAGRLAGFLKQRNGPIHDEPGMTVPLRQGSLPLGTVSSPR